MINIQSLQKNYKGKKGATVQAVKNLTLNVEQGEIFGFVGPNGAGKSTTIKMLLGFCKPDSGRANICGLPINNDNCRKDVGYLPETPVFHDFLTAKEVLETTAALRGIKRHHSKQEITRLLKQVDLQDADKRPVRGFSKGMVQRLGLANALVGNPKLFILDEPMSGLDPIGRNLVRELMLKLREQGKTIFFSSHILHDVETICDKIGILLNGTLKFEGRLDDILIQENGRYSIQFLSSDEFRGINGKLNGVSTALQKISEHTYQISVPGNKKEKYLALLLKNKFNIINLQSEHFSLEQYFMNLIQNS